MPLHADLYLDRIDLTRHVGTETCQVCRVDSLAEGLAASVSEILGRPVEIGPICAAELPLFFAQDWVC